MRSRDRDDAAARLAALLESSEDAIITTDLDSTITSWNAAATQLYGFTPEEAVGKSMLLVFPADRGAEEQALIDTVKAGGTIRDVDAVRTRRSGANIPIVLTVAPVCGADGAIVGTLRIARDVSGRDRAERAARRLAAIVASSDDVIVSKDLNGIVTSWNDAAERTFGYTAAEMIGESIRRIIPDDRQGEEDTVLAAIRRGDKVDHFETIRRHKNGTLIPISLTVSPIRDGNGNIVGASKIARDISERKRADAERARLLAIAEQNAAMMEKLNDVGAVVASALDRGRVAAAVIDAGRELTGAEWGAFFYDVADGGSGEGRMMYTSSGAPGQAFAEVAASRASDLSSAFTNARAVRVDDITTDSFHGGTEVHGAISKSLRTRSYLAVPVCSRSGDVLGALCFGHAGAGVFGDRAERLALGIASWGAVALENARLYAELQQANRVKDEFLATLSHELRTPLNAILGYTRMIRDGIISQERQPEAVATIERNAASLTQIVEDVLDVSRIVSGKLRLNVRAADLNEVVRNAIEAVMPAADAKGIDIIRRFDTGVPPVLGDAERLQQVIWNLLSNAAKFTPNGGRVEVSVARAERDVEVIVKDNGIGISRAFLPHIFERFRQADSTTTRERGGLGLGLGIARQLVEMHGGVITASSEGPGHGSTFRVRLPILVAEHPGGPRRTPESKTSRQAPRPAVPDLQGVRVLVVDDDADALEMAREILNATGADVSVAASALDALDALEASVPDVIVADLAMPRVDGFELIRRIRENAAFRHIPAAALTAYARSEDRDRALKSGFQMHLPKPIDPIELMTAVATLARPVATSPDC